MNLRFNKKIMGLVAALALLVSQSTFSDRASQRALVKKQFGGQQQAKQEEVKKIEEQQEQAQEPVKQAEVKQVEIEQQAEMQPAEEKKAPVSEAKSARQTALKTFFGAAENITKIIKLRNTTQDSFLTDWNISFKKLTEEIKENIKNKKDNSEQAIACDDSLQALLGWLGYSLKQEKDTTKLYQIKQIESTLTFPIKTAKENLAIVYPFIKKDAETRQQILAQREQKAEIIKEEKQQKAKEKILSQMQLAEFKKEAKEKLENFKQKIEAYISAKTKAETKQTIKKELFENLVRLLSKKNLNTEEVNQLTLLGKAFPKNAQVIKNKITTNKIVVKIDEQMEKLEKIQQELVSAKYEANLKAIPGIQKQKEVLELSIQKLQKTLDDAHKKITADIVKLAEQEKLRDAQKKQDVQEMTEIVI